MNTQETLEDLLHELANIVQNLKPSAEFISKSSTRKFDKEAIIEHSKIILQNTMLIDLQMQMANHKMNPEFFSFQRPEPRNIHGKFFKAIECFRKHAKDKKGISIEFNSERITTLIDSYPTIDSAPFILLDNAVKYAPKYSTIEVTLEEYDDCINTKVSNQGPLVRHDEIDKIFERGFRSEEALKTDTEGSGLGLNFLKDICSMHDAKIRVDNDGSEINFSGIKYTNFTCEIEFKKLLESNY